jgi:integrase
MARSKGDGTLFQKKNKRGKLISKYWYLKWVMNGKPRVVSTKCVNRKEAELRAKEILRPFRAKEEVERLEYLEAEISINQQKASTPQHDKWAYCPITKLVDTFMEIELNNGKHKADNTIANYEQYQHNLIKYIATKKLNVVVASDIGKPFVEDYLGYARRKWGSSKFNGMLCFFRMVWGAFGRLSIHRSIKNNPWLGYDYRPREKVYRKEFSEEQFQEIMKVAKARGDESDFFFQLEWDTGLRKGDACCLKWEDVDFDKGFLTPTMQKTKRMVRIPIQPTLMKLLKKRKAALDAMSEDERTANDEIFVSPRLEHIYRSRHIDWIVRKVFKAANIAMMEKDEDGKKHSIFSTHSFRHTMVARLYNAGVPIETIREIVGHTSKKMTRRYNHVFDATLKEAMKKVEDGVVLSPSELAFGGSIPTKSEVALDRETMRLVEQFKCEGEDVNDLLKRLLGGKGKVLKSA